MKLISSFFFFLFTFSSFAQQKLQYDEEFKFKDGIYLSFLDFKNNNPVPITHILSELDIRAKDYLEQVLYSDTLLYYDNLLEERSVDVRQVWGFCASGKVHIGFNTVERNPRWDDRHWFPLITIGEYSYFTAYMLVTRFIPASPTMMPGMGVGIGGGMYGSSMNGDGNYYQESVPVQMLLEFRTGNLIQLATGDLNTVSPELLARLLESDSKLLAEYESKSKRDQKLSAMYYIRRFNERNPIYFPVYP